MVWYWLCFKRQWASIRRKKIVRYLSSSATLCWSSLIVLGCICFISWWIRYELKVKRKYSCIFFIQKSALFQPRINPPFSLSIHFVSCSHHALLTFEAHELEKNVFPHKPKLWRYDIWSNGIAGETVDFKLVARRLLYWQQCITVLLNIPCSDRPDILRILITK